MLPSLRTCTRLGQSCLGALALPCKASRCCRFHFCPGFERPLFFSLQMSLVATSALGSAIAFVELTSRATSQIQLSRAETRLPGPIRPWGFSLGTSLTGLVSPFTFAWIPAAPLHDVVCRAGDYFVVDQLSRPGVTLSLPNGFRCQGIVAATHLCERSCLFWA